MPPDPADPPAEPRDHLVDVLVVTFRKGFWASPEAERFPHRVYGTIVRGHSTSLLNTVLLALRTTGALIRHRPRLLLFGSAHRLVPLALVLRRLGLLRTKLVVTNQVRFGPRWARFADRVIVYSRREARAGPSYRFLPIPADGDFDAISAHESAPPYVFSGGAANRDFDSLVQAIAGTGHRLVVVTDDEGTLALTGPLPPECEVHWRMPLQQFLTVMAGARLVVVPLLGGEVAHGHTTVAQALCLGKAVVTTRSAGVDDYVHDGLEGLLVDAEDVAGYRDAVLRLLADEELRRACEARARARAADLSYAAFADRLDAMCVEVLGDGGP